METAITLNDLEINDEITVHTLNSKYSLVLEATKDGYPIGTLTSSNKKYAGPYKCYILNYQLYVKGILAVIIETGPEQTKVVRTSNITSVDINNLKVLPIESEGN